jgi:hypothetical protein
MSSKFDLFKNSLYYESLGFNILDFKMRPESIIAELLNKDPLLHSMWVGEDFHVPQIHKLFLNPIFPFKLLSSLPLTQTIHHSS